MSRLHCFLGWWFHGGGVLASLIACGMVLGTPQAGLAQDRPTTLRGVVADSISGAPIVNATVIVVGSGTTGVTNPRGTFELTLTHGPSLVLQFHGDGYRSMEVEIDFPNEHVAEVDLGTIPLPPVALPLDSLVVEGVAGTADLAEFRERRGRGVGHFITEADVAKQKPTRVSQLFRSIPSVKLRCRGGSGCIVTSERQIRQSIRIDLPSPRDTLATEFSNPADTLGTDCPIPVYVDGVPRTDMDVDALAPDDIAGIEIYTGALAPAKYRGNNCGLILIWSKGRRRG